MARKDATFASNEGAMDFFVEEIGNTLVAAIAKGFNVHDDFTSEDFTLIRRNTGRDGKRMGQDQRRR